MLNILLCLSSPLAYAGDISLAELARGLDTVWV